MEIQAEPTVSHAGVFSVQVCVPAEWTDAQAIELAERMYPCGTDVGWQIRRQGSSLLAGADERVKCATRDGFVHIMLDA